MNEHEDGSELPELTSNDDVELLYRICKRASDSIDPPFKALFAAYDEVFAEEKIEQEHDTVVFRYLMRVGESTRAVEHSREAIDLVELLRTILENIGISIVDGADEGQDDITRSTDVPSPAKGKRLKDPKRRVSFDDTHLDKTWLSKYSQPINSWDAATAGQPSGLLPRRGRDAGPGRRARSISAQRSPAIRSVASKHSQLVSSKSASEAGDLPDPNIDLRPSSIELEQRLEAFLSISTIRLSRQALHVWYDRALQSHESQAPAYSKAIAHDRRTLLRQSWESWRDALVNLRELQRRLREEQNIRREEQDREANTKYLEQKASRHRSQYVLKKAFTHWATSCADERAKTTIAKNHILKVTYFKRWKKIAIENQVKVRSISLRRFLSIWRAKSNGRLLWQEQAEAHYEEQLMRSHKRRWFWHMCSRRVEGWHHQWIEKRAMRNLVDAFQIREEQHRRADDVCSTNVARRALRSLFDRSELHARLAPLASNMRLKVNLNLQRNTFRVWYLHLSLTRQAAEVDRKRILQTAWTNWNDGLRCRALAQKIDERVLIENLYRWVLQERLKLFQRTIDGRLLGRAFARWITKARQERDKLAEAEVIFAERGRRRRLAFGMVRLNIAMRYREDAERAAVEMANSRVLPNALNIWREKADGAQMLDKWAADARFYTLCSLALKVWSVRTTEHKHNRRRNAYVQLRARVKIRLVGQCFVKWRTKAMDIHSMNAEAERRAEVRIVEVASSTLDRWRKKSAQCTHFNVQAMDFYQQNLLGSAVSALLLRREDLESMDQGAIKFRQETDLVLLATVLRRTQWATFTVTRKTESATALLAKNRDQHIKQMVRHWASQAAVRTATARGDARTSNGEDPESPSLQPASRAASRMADVTFPSSPPETGVVQATPGYMRTPSRGRRAGRFRPIPTPAPFRPMSFNSAYLATTPAPVPNPVQPGPDPFDGDMTSLTPQVTPFSRKLRAGGFTPAPPSALRNTGLGRSVQGGTNKSVRFASARRFRATIDEGHEKNS